MEVTSDGFLNAIQPKQHEWIRYYGFQTLQSKLNFKESWTERETLP